MNFEHLVEINEPHLPGVAWLSREELWRGLVIRAEQPDLTMVGLESCRILTRGPDYLRRELDFGKFQVRDWVRFESLVAVTYETEASAELGAGRLTMTIEEPEQGRLFVRFSYRDSDPEPSTDQDRMVTAHLQQAYIQADIDTITTIRHLASQGLLTGQQ